MQNEDRTRKPDTSEAQNVSAPRRSAQRYGLFVAVDAQTPWDPSGPNEWVDFKSVNAKPGSQWLVELNDAGFLTVQPFEADPA